VTTIVIRFREVFLPKKIWKTFFTWNLKTDSENIECMTRIADRFKCDLISNYTNTPEYLNILIYYVFDESIISIFYIIFNLVLFRFKFILFYYYSLFELFNELVINLFYIIFNPVLFRFEYILYYCYFLFEQFTLSFNKIYLRNEYWVEQSWSKRKRIRSWFGLEKYKIQHKNTSSPSQKLGTARAKCVTAVPPLKIPFAAFSSPASYSVL